MRQFEYIDIFRGDVSFAQTTGNAFDADIRNTGCGLTYSPGCRDTCLVTVALPKVLKSFEIRQRGTDRSSQALVANKGPLALTGGSFSIQGFSFNVDLNDITLDRFATCVVVPSFAWRGG